MLFIDNALESAFELPFYFVCRFTLTKKEKNLPALCTLHLVQVLMSVFQCFLQGAKKEEQKQRL